MLKINNQVMQWLIYHKFYGGITIYHEFLQQESRARTYLKNQSTTQIYVPECDPSRNSAWYETKFERI